MHQFNEHHPEFAGFSKLFDREIAPQLRERDGDRVMALRRARIIGGTLALVLASGLWFLVWVLRNDEDIVGVVGAALAAPVLLYLGIHTFMLKKVRGATKDVLVGTLFRHLGWQFDAEVEDFDVQAWRDAFLVPKKASRIQFEDRVSGPAHGALFNSVEAHFQVRTRNGYRTTFQGQLIWLTFPKPLGMGRTIVLRDKGLFNAKKKKDMKRVGLVDPVFEKLFEAYSTDQVGARVVLDPVFMQRMVDLESALDGKNIRYAFDDKTMLIAVETKNLYEAGDMKKELADPARAQRVLDEVGAAFDIVDHLSQRPSTRIG